MATTKQATTYPPTTPSNGPDGKPLSVDNKACPQGVRYQAPLKASHVAGQWVTGYCTAKCNPATQAYLAAVLGCTVGNLPTWVTYNWATGHAVGASNWATAYANRMVQASTAVAPSVGASLGKQGATWLATNGATVRTVGTATPADVAPVADDKQATPTT